MPIFRSLFFIPDSGAASHDYLSKKKKNLASCKKKKKKEKLRFSLMLKLMLVPSHLAVFLFWEVQRHILLLGNIGKASFA